MPVLLPALTDPTDVLMQGEQLRSLAMSQPVGALGPLIFAQSSGVVLPGDDANTLGVEGNDWGQPLATHDTNLLLEPLIASGAGIATPMGAWIPREFLGIAISDVPTSRQRWAVQGTTRNKAATAVLPGCRVVIFEIGRLQGDSRPVVGETISDGAGNYSVSVPLNVHYQVIAYLPGSPDVAGITRADVLPDPNG